MSSAMRGSGLLMAGAWLSEGQEGEIWRGLGQITEYLSGV